MGSELHPQAESHPADDIATALETAGPEALETVARLQNNGFEAYLVGGCIRDLLLGKTPKDFDVATDARPEEVRKLFERSRIVGRRFQIVHVRQGRQVIEVTTFRGDHSKDEDSQDAGASEQAASGMLLRDNVYGDIAADAERRDFSINALYLCADSDAILDFCGGMADIKTRKLRVIGDPAQRYAEDPVRLLRAARFKAKLPDFTFEEKSAAPIAELGHLLLQVSPARLFDEVLKAFMQGFAKKSLETLLELDLFQFLFPTTADALREEQTYARDLLIAAMENTDVRIAADKPVTPAFLFAALLWPAVVKRSEELEAQGMKDHEALYSACQEIAAKQQQHTAIPKRFSVPMREIWSLQSRLHRNDGKRAERLYDQRRFRAAYDFILLREQAGEDLDGLGDWWTAYQEEHPPPESHKPRGGHRNNRGGNRGGSRGGGGNDGSRQDKARGDKTRNEKRRGRPGGKNETKQENDSEADNRGNSLAASGNTGTKGNERQRKPKSPRKKNTDKNRSAKRSTGNYDDDNRGNTIQDNGNKRPQNNPNGNR